MHYSEDPYINVVHGQLKKDVRVLMDNECYSGAVKLIYSGIDVMAWLDMPKKRVQSVRNSEQAEYFRKWVRNYIIDPNGMTLDKLLWESRNAVIHTHTVYSRKMRRGSSEVVPVAFADKMWPPVKGSEKICVVSVHWLAKSFFEGVDKFMVSVFDNQQKRKIAEKRLEDMMHIMPINKDNSDGNDTPY